MQRTLTILLAGWLWAVQAQSPIPPEVKFKARYVNSTPKPAEFNSAMLWGIAVADTRAPGHERATVEVARVQLSCRVDGKDVVLNDDRGEVRGGLYLRHPWFGTDEHDPMPVRYSEDRRSVILGLGTRPDKVWHFWAASPRRTIPRGRLEGCLVNVRARVSRGALLQVGFDYWRDASVGYEKGGNNHEAGASDWYLPSKEWQTAEFTDVAGP